MFDETLTAVPTKSHFGKGFWLLKRLLDIVVSIALFPVLAFFMLLLLVLNPIWNKGPIFYRQTRMGRHCKPFEALKFRSMRETTAITRKSTDPIEEDRITPLGAILRKLRIDELPQIINVLYGDMSLIGPRPDYYPHALEYIDLYSPYKDRHAIRPGISGLAQIQVGYADDHAKIADKVQNDIEYINSLSLRQELKLVWRTVLVVLRGEGT